MKKTAFVLFFCLFLCLLTSCAGLGDWDAPLTGGYEVWRMSGHDITIVKVDEEIPGTAEEVVPAEVYAVSWNDEYIFAEVESMPPVGVDLPIYDVEPHGQFRYYIIVTATGDVLGPLNAARFEKACTELGVTPPDSWTPVRELQEGGAASEEYLGDMIKT